MQSVPEQIFIGVVGGVLTSACLYVLGLLFFRIVLPWYRRVTYNSVVLDGTWEYRYDQPGDFVSMVLGLSQNAHELSGEAAVTVRGSTGEINLIFEASGTIWEGYASLILKSKDRRVIAFSTLLLKVANNGSTLEGVYSFREPTTDRAKSVDFFLNRK